MWKRKYVWEFPVRLQHWLHVVAMLALTVTGVYVASPFLGLAAGQTVDTHITDWMRFSHFVAAWILGLGFLVRLYWFFVGNEFARWSGWLPLGREKLRGLVKQMRYYLFLDRVRPRYTGVNPVSGLTYLFLGVILVLQGATGIALYAEPLPGGFWRATFGWMLTTFGPQAVRFTHHALMYIFAIFLLVHLYMMVLGDIEEGNAPVTGIISGWKFEPAEKEE
ncbi:MAG: Ni/Fe-hydrogenase, b-type cytochrome subunit [Anaerolineae bacterium]|jgi:Ni/Fe-hydrogenase 1 B-type cytochrome subunit